MYHSNGIPSVPDIRRDDDVALESPYLHVDRPALTIAARHRQCLYEAPDKVGLREKMKEELKESCACSKQKLWDFLMLRLPVLDWLVNYDLKNWLPGDVIAGITIAIFHIPQGMGFVLLANVPAICGIYMAFFPVLIYAIFATSRHVSVGSFAVITLMTGKVVKELATFPPAGKAVAAAAAVTANVTNGLEDVTTEAVTEVVTEVVAVLATNATDVVSYTPIEIATIVCFMVGVWQMIFGLLQLGSLCVFLSDMLVSGFTTGAAIHVVASQIKDMLGITHKGFNGPLKLVYTFIDIIRVLPTVNLATLVVTVITIVVLVINNEILKPIVSRYSRVPVPIELIVVIIATATSQYGFLADKFDIDVVGDIPTGLPPPTLPPLELMGKVALDSFVIAIVAYAITFSLAKIFAIKSAYQVDATQEMYAQSLGNLFSSFFACPPMSAALSRTIIQHSVGGQTQMVSFICCFLIIWVLLFIGPLFEALPKAVLASIIVVALKAMYMQVFDAIAMWKVSKSESIMWVVTFVSVVIIDIDLGLLVGVIFALFVLLAKNQKPATVRLGRVPKTDLYLDVASYPEAKEIPGFRIFRIIGAIHFANRDNTKSFIAAGTGLNPKEMVKENERNKQSDIENIVMKENGSSYDVYVLHNALNSLEEKVKFLILDVGGLSYVDSSGGKFLDQLRLDYKEVDITLCIAGLSEKVLKMMDKCGCLKEFPSNHLFHSVHDAVTILTCQKF